MLGAASAAYLAWLASLTLGPQPEGAGGTLKALSETFATLPVTAWLTYPVLEFTANVALFTPVGALWVLWTGPRRWWLATGVGLALSAAIELTQAIALPARYPDVRDLIANTLGAAVGAGAVAAIARVSRRARRSPGAGDLTAGA
ncbi:VanZ family protein [Microbacterium sp. zg.Y1090]|uniref:VanZ family protein n=1 Tax=Microbacterium TaxID=33882 RepID=UPI00214D04CE|nr:MULTISPECIES: VanZ family protein [unclassified Microbacterium]MCR2812202.1 VanZ family protein [Microbacterium sp. zg.Y1084]MCR2818360.1 VanZ family protein [Microbacterium sp. zg.Y1090]MDL5486172.1 VanZ family protein [Microbacterium sp. zg-Y1211]WIM29379.1 VanZ family protein [Microbacterium sp. zg-Y1090]